MRNLALVLSAFGFIAFAGIAHADQKSENTEKTDTSTTLSGKHKTTHTKKSERADGSSVETKTVTTSPKDVDKRDEMNTRDEADKRDDSMRARHDENNDNGVESKTTEHTTLTGKKEMKTTKKVQHPDGSETETTTTRTEPKH